VSGGTGTSIGRLNKIYGQSCIVIFRSTILSNFLYPCIFGSYIRSLRLMLPDIYTIHALDGFRLNDELTDSSRLS
jgi:hypothetical protein